MQCYSTKLQTFILQHTLILVGVMGLFACGPDDRFTTASYRLQRSELQREIKEIKALTKEYPYSFELRAELKKKMRALNKLERQLNDVKNGKVQMNRKNK